MTVGAHGAYHQPGAQGREIIAKEDGGPLIAGHAMTPVATIITSSTETTHLDVLVHTKSMLQKNSVFHNDTKTITYLWVVCITVGRAYIKRFTLGFTATQNPGTFFREVDRINNCIFRVFPV